MTNSDATASADLKTTTPFARPPLRLAVIGMMTAALVAALCIYMAWQQPERWQWWALVADSAALLISLGVSAVLFWRNRVASGATVFVITGQVTFLIASALMAGLGLLLGLGSVLFALVIGVLALPPRRARWLVASGIVAGLLGLAADLLALRFRLEAPASLRISLSIVIGAALIICIYSAARRIPALTLRTKLSLSFLAAAGLPVGVLAILNYLHPADTQTISALIAALVVCLLTLGVGLGRAFRLGDSLKRLAAVAERVSTGDLDARAGVEVENEVGQLAQTFNRMTAHLQKTLQDLEHGAQVRAAQLQAAADIGRVTTSVRNLDELLRLALDLICERFGYYHASIYLMDEAGTYAVLRESTGEIGAELKARGHKLAVGSNSLIGWVTDHRAPRAALDTAGDPFHVKNPRLPDTRSELAIPLVIGDRLLGTLDVQSTEVNAFSDSDVRVLQALADQLSVAIENAELFQTTQATLAEVTALYQKAAAGAWRTLLEGRPHEVVYELQAGTGPLPAAPGGPPVTIPLRLRSDVVGSLELHGRAADSLSAEERAILETATAQLAVALESAALLAEMQRRSHHEQLVNTITYQMRSTLDPASIMQSGIRELGKALGATEVIVKLTPTAAPRPKGGAQEG
jgi:GAF domain-containing protein/HAMP domain-containing protein